MAQFINTVFNCVSLSSIILLTSLGLAITFGLMKVINMAHGELLIIGAYMTYVVHNIFEKFSRRVCSVYITSLLLLRLSQ